jgi:hypothetical protein
MAAVAVVAVLMGALVSVPRCLLWLEDTSYYAPSYSEQKNISIKCGMRASSVLLILGEPLKVEKVTAYTEWIYGPGHLRVSDHAEPYTLQEPVRSGDPRDYTILIAEPTGEITFASGGYLRVNEGSLVGRTLSEIESRFGKPLKVIRETARHYLVYSGTTCDGSYYVRKIGIDETNRVNNVVAGWYQD